jgi:hypothetical protein
MKWCLSLTRIYEGDCDKMKNFRNVQWGTILVPY